MMRFPFCLVFSLFLSVSVCIAADPVPPEELTPDQRMKQLQVELAALETKLEQVDQQIKTHTESRAAVGVSLREQHRKQHELREMLLQEEGIAELNNAIREKTQELHAMHEELNVRLQEHEAFRSLQTDMQGAVAEQQQHYASIMGLADERVAVQLQIQRVHRSIAEVEAELSEKLEEANDDAETMN